jgi:hypothetical protein
LVLPVPAPVAPVAQVMEVLGAAGAEKGVACAYFDFSQILRMVVVCVICV